MWKSIKQQFLLDFFHAVLFDPTENQAQSRVTGIIINPNPYENAYHYQADPETFFRLSAKNLLCAESAIYLIRRLLTDLLTMLAAGMAAVSTTLMLCLTISYLVNPVYTVGEIIRMANIESLNNFFRMSLLFFCVLIGMMMLYRVMTERVSAKSYRFNRQMKLLMELKETNELTETKF